VKILAFVVCLVRVMPLNDLAPAPGRVLVAPPTLRDPNFYRAVILLCEHGPGGSFGLTLNRPLDVQPREVVAGFYAYRDVLGLGGPVQRDTLHYLHRHGPAVPDSVDLGDGVRWGGSFEAVQALVRKGATNARELRFFVGYAGWSPEQLEAEVEADGWIVAPASADLVFTDAPDALWRRVMLRLGGEFALLANFPDDPRVN
jgi:putative transcriptional regulator